MVLAKDDGDDHSKLHQTDKLVVPLLVDEPNKPILLLFESLLKHIPNFLFVLVVEDEGVVGIHHESDLDLLDFNFFLGVVLNSVFVLVFVSIFN